MEDRDFDLLAREAADTPSRRTIMRGLAALFGVAGVGLALADDADAKKSKKKKRRQRKRKQKKRKQRRKEANQQCNDKKPCPASTNPCQTVTCENNVCVTSNVADGTSCGTGQECSSGQCVAAICSANDECGPNGCSCTQTDDNRETVPGTGRCQQTTFLQTFASNADGWYAMNNTDNTWYPPETDDTILIENGHAVLKAANAYVGNGRTAMSPLGGRTEVFPAGGWDVSLDIYLDLENKEANRRFAYSAAANRKDCVHYQDFVFNVGSNGTDVCIAKNNGASGDNVNVCGLANSVNLTTAGKQSGWYRFVHKFRWTGEELAVQMVVTDLDHGNDVVFDQTSLGTQEPLDDVGGSRYAFFPFNNYDEGVWIRNSQRVNHLS